MLALLSLSSCDLTSETQSTFDESVVFSNYTLAEYNVFSIYEVFSHTNCHRGRYLPWYGFNNDVEMYVSSTYDDAKASIARYTQTATNTQLNVSGNPYSELMVGIERANLCIKGIRQYGNIEADAEMANLYGEALCARALLYAELLKAYGEVPARFEPVGPETIYLNKSDKDVIYKQLLSDLEEAIALMKWPGACAATSTTARPSKAFAEGLYARLALMAAGWSLRPEDGKAGTGDAGTVRKTSDPELQASALYPKALSYLQDCIKNSGLSLYSDYAQLWQDFNNMSLSAGKEVIFVLPFSDARGRWNYTFAVRNEGITQWTNTSSNRGGEAGPVPTLYWKYDAAGHDQRRDVSCANYKFKRTGSDASSDKAVIAGSANWYFGKYRFDWMKSVPYTGGNDDGIKPVYMRYSDILLMAAEIINEGYGTFSDAQDYLAQVRKRAYKGYESEATAYVNGLSQGDQFFNAIVDERALEFVGEMLRKSDLIRWNLLKEKMDAAMADMRALSEHSGAFATVGNNVYYKYNADGYTISLYGYNPGENVDPGEGWTAYTDSEGNTPSNYFSLKDEKINSFYGNGSADMDPNTKQWWPIPALAITDAQGALKNDYGF